MGISAWIWFVIAAVALVVGLGLLFADRAKEGSRNRERMRWAQLRGWQFVEEDERLPRQWAGGAIGYFGAEAAVNVVAGSTFTSDGRRPVFIFDIESQGQVPAVVVAVRCNKTHRVPVEMWLSSVPFQRENMPEMLGPIGQRYAFADDAEGARQVITQELVDAADQLGGDVGVAWLENEWVLASVVPGAGPSRLERLLRDLGEIADIVDPFDEDYDSTGTWTPTTGTPAPSPADTRVTQPVDSRAVETQAPSPADTRTTERQPSPPEPRTPPGGPSTSGAVPPPRPVENPGEEN
ncbi:hypothetical protein [Amycolatopsis jejuensis]|uniref:hypothetical protein n=1 Tax=Amycolatopsis jejuensis TaxID=330084 RepID=UPI000524D9FF|nr:hypothetical protein [Amycolatopsis jejuensis]